MNKLFAKIGLGEKMSKNFLAILIVAFGGAIIYGLPYFRFDYYDVYLETYHLTNTQMGVFGSVLGVFGMISYLFGGVVADRVSTRIILTVSLIGTGLVGFFICFHLVLKHLYVCMHSGESVLCLHLSCTNSECSNSSDCHQSSSDTSSTFKETKRFSLISGI